MTQLPDSCPSCGIETSPATVTEVDSDLVCVECSEVLVSDSEESPRVNYKSPVVPEDEEHGNE